MSIPPEEIKSLVRQVVTRTLGASSPGSARRPKRILSADDVTAMPTHSVQAVAANTLITPLARQIALERHIRLEQTAERNIGSVRSPIATAPTPQPHLKITGQTTVAIGADHGGYELKGLLMGVLAEQYRVIDCGAYSKESVDYPDFAYAVAQLVADGRAWRGIIIDGAGIGSCMAANKVPGVRAAMCYDQATAVNSREHNNANVLTLGAGLIGPNLARQIVTAWLNTEFAGGRHARRVDKIDQIGARFAK